MQTILSRSLWTAEGNDPSLARDGALCAGGPESLWLTYTRLAAWPSIVCGAASVLLHQLTCQMATEPTHWGIAAFIGGLCFVLALGLCVSQKRGLSSIALATTVLLVSAIGLLSWDHCRAHQFALCGLIGLSVPLVVACVHDLRMRSQSGICQFAVRASTAGQNVVSGSTEIEQPERHHGDVIASGVEQADSPKQVAQRPFWARHAVAIVLGSASFVYLVAVPTVSMVRELIWPSAAAARALTEMSIAESLRLHAVSVVVMLIFLAAGASIGSFLNVVIFRLPRRRPLLLPSSACPNCDTEITGTDNIPVVSWLRLGGRCRNCGIAISARYPTIESIVGLVFVVFYFRELLSGGANLPVRVANMYNGIVWILLYTKWDLVSLYFFHMFVLVTLLAWGMINYDRFRVPMRSGVVSFGLTLGLAGVVPQLNPIASAWELTLISVPASLTVSVLGCLVGLVGAMLLWPISRRSDVAVGGAFELARFLGTQRAEVPALGFSTEGTGEEASETVAQELPKQVIDRVGCESERVGFEPCEVAHDDSIGSELDRELYGGPSSEPDDRANIAFSLALVGAALGYESVLLVVAFTAAMVMASKLLRGVVSRVFGNARPWPVTLWVFVSTATVLVVWQEVFEAYSKYVYAMLGAS